MLKSIRILWVLLLWVQLAAAANLSISDIPIQPGTIIVSGQPTFLLSTINVTPHTITVTSGSTITFSARGFDQDNNNVTISRQVNWTVSNTAAGKIIPINMTSGLFTALAAGTTTVIAAIDNISATATAIVTAGMSHDVASHDLNNDGHIQKNEALAAVVDYFSGRITKSAAIEVVVAYFTGE